MLVTAKEKKEKQKTYLYWTMARMRAVKLAYWGQKCFLLSFISEPSEYNAVKHVTTLYT